MGDAQAVSQRQAGVPEDIHFDQCTHGNPCGMPSNGTPAGYGSNWARDRGEVFSIDFRRCVSKGVGAREVRNAASLHPTGRRGSARRAFHYGTPGTEGGGWATVPAAAFPMIDSRALCGGVSTRVKAKKDRPKAGRVGLRWRILQASSCSFILFMAFFSICRIRSADTPNCSASSCRVCFFSLNQRALRMVLLRSSSRDRAA